MKQHAQIALCCAIGIVLAVGAAMVFMPETPLPALAQWGLLGALTGLVFGGIVISRKNGVARKLQFWGIWLFFLLLHGSIFYALIIAFDSYPAIVTGPVAAVEWYLLDAILRSQGFPAATGWWT
jgi:hypothetical protein